MIIGQEIKSKHEKRLQWIDFAKGLAIILVVYRHIMIGLIRAGLDVDQIYIVANEIVYTFRMPLFFLLTGFFIRRSLSKRSTNEFISNKFKTLLYPYLIWSFIQVSIQIIMNNYTNANRHLIDYAYIVYHPRAIDQFWFLFALFNNSIIFLIMTKFFKNRRIVILIIAIIFHYLATLVPEIDLLKDALYYFIFLVIGDMLSKILMDERKNGLFKSPILLFILLPIFILGQIYWFEHKLDINIFLFAVIEIIGSVLILNLSFLLASNKYLNFIKIAGNYSLYIYVMHVIISAGIRIFMMNILKIDQVPVLLAFGVIFGCIIPIIFYKYSLKFGYWWLFYPYNPNKKVLIKT